MFMSWFVQRRIASWCCISWLFHLNFAPLLPFCSHTLTCCYYKKTLATRVHKKRTKDSLNLSVLKSFSVNKQIISYFIICGRTWDKFKATIPHHNLQLLGISLDFGVSIVINIFAACWLYRLYLDQTKYDIGYQICPPPEEYCIFSVIFFLLKWRRRAKSWLRLSCGW